MNILKGRTSSVAILSRRRIYLGLGNAIYSNGLDRGVTDSVTAFFNASTDCGSGSLHFHSWGRDGWVRVGRGSRRRARSVCHYQFSGVIDIKQNMNNNATIWLACSHVMHQAAHLRIVS
jgi:hypothetical protein